VYELIEDEAVQYTEELLQEDDGQDGQRVTGAIGVPSVELLSETLRDESVRSADRQWEILKSGCTLNSSKAGGGGGEGFPDFENCGFSPDTGETVELHHRAGLASTRDRHAGTNGFSDVGLFEEISEEINGLEDEEVEIDVAADSGACAHVVGPEDLPANVRIRNVVKRRFHGANNSPIEHHGEAVVQLVQEDGTVATSTVQVAGVCRPLHSVSVICDGPAGGAKKEMLYIDTEAVVVPAGALSKFLATCKRLATYPRVGGLYVAKVKVRNPPSSAAVKSEDFTRPGRGR